MNSESDLHEVARQGDTGTAARLLDQGADVNSCDSEGYTPLHWAVTSGYQCPDRLDLAKLLLSRGADPNARTRSSLTPLLLAANRKLFQQGHVMVLLLLSYGADPNACLTTRFGNQAPLHRCVYHGDIVAVEYLLISGADVNIRGGRNNTPLHLAAYKDRDEVTRVLLTAGADVRAQNDGQQTPLQVAQENKATAVMRLLIGL